MSDQDPSRLDMEIELLTAMYPDQAAYDSKAREFKFTQGNSAMQLRLPEDYPYKGVPDVIAATDASKNDLRSRTKAAVKELGLTQGEEALDAIVAAFQQVLEDSNDARDSQNSSAIYDEHINDSSNASKTVVIWLHHLLALTKRKLAISSTSLSGITKPGYPGIMIFSGPSAAVAEHVNTLKAENWQAFQVRYEEEELWTFAHGSGVKEVETMAEVVKAVGGDGKREEGGGNEMRKRQTEEFLKAVGIK